MAIRCSDATARLHTSSPNLDPTADFTIFGWGKQVVAWEGVGTQQTCTVWFAGGSEDYSDPYIFVGIKGFGGAGDFSLELGGGAIVTELLLTFLPPLNTWFWFAVTYNATTHQWTFILNGTIAGHTTRDFSGVGAFTSATAGGDPSEQGTNISMAYVRVFPQILTAAQLLVEAAKPLGVVTASLDTPLQYVGDLTDYSDNGGDWTAVGAPESDFNGPLGNPTAFAHCAAPESTDLFFYDSEGRLLAVTPAPHPTTERLVAVCPTRDGYVWAAYDVVANRAADATSSMLRKIRPSTGAIVAETAVAFVVAELAGHKSLFELPDGTLLTVDRGTHTLVSLDPTTGDLVTTYSLVIDPLDADLNAAGTKLLFADNS